MPRELFLGECDVLVSDFVEDDGRGADQVALGALLGRLHRAPLPRGVLAGYPVPIPVDSAAFWTYRPDAAVMLALLFSSETSRAELGPLAVDWLCDEHEQLTRELGRLRS